MDMDQPDLQPRGRKSKTPLIIGIVVALHVVLIGSAFVIQEINKRTRPLEEAVAADPEHPESTLADATAPAIETPAPMVTEPQPQPQPV
jgi:hypothetical protein